MFLEQSCLKNIENVTDNPEHNLRFSNACNSKGENFQPVQVLYYKSNIF